MPSPIETKPRLLRARDGLSADIVNDRTVTLVVDAALTIHDALGSSHDASTYRDAMAVELVARGARITKNATFSVIYRKTIVGTFVADLVVDDAVLIRVTADDRAATDHRHDVVRGLASGDIRVGLVFNFAGSALHFARLC